MALLGIIFGTAAIVLTVISTLTIIWKRKTRLIPVSKHEVIWAWLCAEYLDPSHKYNRYYQSSSKDFGTPELTSPDFNDEQQNKIREDVFNNVRGKFLLWKPIVHHTQWYSTSILCPGNIVERIVKYLPMNVPYIYGPYKPAEQPHAQKSDLTHMVLWGHTKQGPYIVLEGNHRFYNRIETTLMPKVYVGLSDQPYELHHTSGCEMCRIDVHT